MVEKIRDIIRKAADEIEAIDEVVVPHGLRQPEPLDATLRPLDSGMGRGNLRDPFLRNVDRSQIVVFTAEPT